MNDIIARYIESEGISQAELARRIGVSEAMVSRMLDGSRRPGLRVALAMSREMRIPVERFAQ